MEARSSRSTITLRTSRHFGSVAHHFVHATLSFAEGLHEQQAFAKGELLVLGCESV
jgi:hypothetical protein